MRNRRKRAVQARGRSVCKVRVPMRAASATLNDLVASQIPPGRANPVRSRRNAWDIERGIEGEKIGKAQRSGRETIEKSEKEEVRYNVVMIDFHVFVRRCVCV